MNTRRVGIGLAVCALMIGLDATIASAAPPMVRATMPVRPMPAAYNYYPRSYYQPYAPYAAYNAPVLPYYYGNNFAYRNYMLTNLAIAQNINPMPYVYNPYPYAPVYYNYGAAYYNPYVNPYAGFAYTSYGVNPYLLP